VSFFNCITLKQVDFLHLMSKFLMDSFEYVANVRKDSYGWILSPDVTVLEIERGGIEHNYKSVLPGIRGTSQCCHKYLQYVMGYEIVNNLTNVPGHEGISGVVWKKLIGNFSSKDVYHVLYEKMVEADDRRAPDGDRVVDGVTLSLIVENRRDFHELIQKHYLSKRDLVMWMQKRYSPKYALFVTDKVMKFQCTRKEIGERIEVIRGKPQIEGVRLMRSVVRALGAYPLGMRMTELAKEISRTWTVEGDELAFVLAQYLDIKWLMRYSGILPIYYLKPVFNQHFVRNRDNGTWSDDRYDKWRVKNNPKLSGVEQKIKEIFGTCKLSGGLDVG